MVATDLEEIKREIDELTNKIIKRMISLGEEDTITYRHDEIIMKYLRNICELYRKEVGLCEHYRDKEDPFCSLLRDEPEIIKRLELSEEFICPLK